MKKQSLQELLIKRQNGSITVEELARLETWYNQHAEVAKSYDNIEGYLKDMQEMDAAFPFVTETPVKKVRLWPRVAIVAAVALIISGAYFYNRTAPVKSAVETTYVNDIAPGKVGATLTLASGKKINLTDAADGELAQEAGISVNKTADGQLVYTVKESTDEKNKINTLTTANGETYILTLPDKSKVWMNAASSLTYATSLNERGERRVKLSGEAYFQIAKDKAHPFIVESRGQSIEVLGTHFNVSSYADEANVRTTLEEGSVKVSATGNASVDAGLIKILKPGQQSVVGPDGLSVRQADLETDLAWKNGDFVFDHEDFESIIRKVEKWYDVEFIYQKGNYSKVILSGSVSRANPLSVVLVSLQKAGRLKFKIEGRRVTIM